MTTQYAAFLSRITDRAERLEADGYVIKLAEGSEVTYLVKSPRLADGTRNVYVVTAMTNYTRCECPCFAKHKTCKHLQAVVLKREREEQDAAHYEAFSEEYSFDKWVETQVALIENAEYGEFGCDPHAEF